MSESGKQSNFKIAVGELMGGKSKTARDESSPDRGDFPQETGLPPSVQPLRRVESVIADDMIIEGTVTAHSDIRIHGKIRGNVTTASSILASGSIDGNIEAENITLAGSTVNGDVSAENALLVDEEAIVIGNLSSGSLELDGRVKGDLQIDRSILLKQDSIVFGDITAKSLSIEEGACIRGMVNVMRDDLTERTFLSRGKKSEEAEASASQPPRAVPSAPVSNQSEDPEDLQ